MIKKLLSIGLILCNLFLFSQSFNSMYHFTGVQTGSANTGSIDPTPVPVTNGLTFGAFTAFGFTSNPQANGAFAFKEWGNGALNGDNVNFTGSLDPNKYYQVTLTPAANATITFNSIAFHISRSSTGPRHWAVRSSLHSYSVNLPASVVPANANIAVQPGNQFFWALDSYTVVSGKEEKGCRINFGSDFGNITTPLTFRFYAYNAESNAGIFRLDTVIFKGLNQLVTGVNVVSYDLNSHFVLYPNPSNDGNVFVELKNSVLKSIDVFDLTGKLIFTEVNENNTGNIKLNLGALSGGTYYIRSVSDEQVYTEKLIILNK